MRPSHEDTPGKSGRSLKQRIPEEEPGTRSQRTSALQLIETSAGYKLGKSIGTGSYSSVRLAFNLRCGNEMVACKIINQEKASKKFIEKFLPRELDILKKIKHPHIVKVLNIYGLGSKVFVFMNYCSLGDLLDYIRDHGPYSEAQGKVLFGQLSSAVQYLHSMCIAHRDLKCENILLVRTDSLMLTDFGFSRYFRSGATPLSTTFCGSAAYAAPEIIQGSAYNPFLGDVWSMGCVLYIMLLGTMPFDDSDILKMLRIQKSRLLSFSRGSNKKKIGARARVLINKCLEPEPRLRASLRQIQNEAWLNT